MQRSNSPRVIGYDTWIVVASTANKEGDSRVEQGDIVQVKPLNAWEDWPAFTAIGTSQLRNLIYVPFTGLENSDWRQLCSHLDHDETRPIIEGNPDTRLAGLVERKRRYRVLFSAIAGLDMASLEDPTLDYQPFILYDPNKVIIRVAGVEVPFRVEGKIVDKETGALL